MTLPTKFKMGTKFDGDTYIVTVDEDWCRASYIDNMGLVKSISGFTNELERCVERGLWIILEDLSDE